MNAKLSTGIAWTIGSFFVLAISGVVINLVITGFRDAAALGAFNIAYAVYIVASQVAVVGIQYSVLRHTAYYQEDAEERGKMLLTAALQTLGLGLVFGTLLYGVSPQLGHLFDGENVAPLIRYASLGLLFFPLNKVLVSYFNGLRHMRTFAVLQAGRYILVMAWVAYVAGSTLPFAYAGLAFPIAELVTTLAASAFVVQSGLARQLKFDATWFRRHAAFGGKSLPSGLFVEANSRIDVLVLGLMVEEKLVGIYSFAAMIADGLYHVLAMVRVNFNPVLVAAIRDGQWQEGQAILTRSKTLLFPVVLALALCAFGTYAAFAFVILPDKGLEAGLTSLAILLVALSLVSPWIPFDNLPLVSGHPGYQTFQQLAVVSVNGALNLLLVPMWGILGAALGTAASYWMGIAVLFLLSQRLIGWNLLTNRVRPTQPPAPV